MRLLFLLVIVLSIYANYSAGQSDTVEITTTAGVIVGRTTKVENANTEGSETLYVNTFYGIPFAKPPIGNLRFKPPIKAEPWVGKRTAFEKPSNCYQYIAEWLIPSYYSNLSEDCLYLNVWVPNPVPEKAAVMVFIYGGAFSMGSLDMAPFTKFAAIQKVIIVAMNYRVSSLGFLYLGNEEVPGNAGLWDQQLAMQWVHDNIDRFGGDPSKVTLFGQSAGAGSTGHHLLNPNTQKLFQRAILQSGSAYSPWAVDTQDEALQKSLKVAEAVGCTDLNKTQIINCLRNVNSSKLVETSAKLGNVITLFHVPVFDNKIVFENRRETIKDLDKKEVLMGITNDDGAFLVTYLSAISPVKSDKIFDETLKHYIGITNTDLARSIKYYYKDHCNENKENSEEIASAQLGRDYYFTCATTALADDVSSAGFTTFAYQFNHRPFSAVQPKWVKADHGAEFYFILGVVTPAENEISNRMMNYWGCFAKHGNPNCDISRNDELSANKSQITTNEIVKSKSPEIQQWLRYSSENRWRIDINFDSSHLASGALQEEQCAFWKHDVPILSQNKS